ncbi:MAG: aminodeoxychorismate/anthranilate synthase component II [Pseudomonadota bacterium]
MLLLIDNYDSFTWNLVHYLGELGAETRVFRNDALTVEAALALRPQGIVLSPGPRTPQEAGICVELVQHAPTEVPVLGVCLGHQAIGAAFGAPVSRCHEVLHGKLSTITHDGAGIFRDLPQGFDVTRYHSLTLEEATMPDALQVTARAQSGVVMGVRHRARPLHGVQFHPESIRTEHGHQMLKNFLAMTTAPSVAA